MDYNKKGITLLSAVIIIVVLLMFTGTIVVSTDYIIEETNRKEFNREYKIIKSATKDYIVRNSGAIDFEELSLDLTGISSEDLKQFDGEEIVNNTIEMYIIDLEKIGVINTTYGIKKDGNTEDRYLLSKKTNTVYYQKGFENGDNIYFKPIDD